jgi:4a-hydroxytetrahydrobiopterin dehydratase
MTKLTDGQIENALLTRPEWAHVGEAIQRTYQFRDFVQAMKFVDQVALAAEQAQHHPDILIRYNKVTLTLATHDAGGITEKDFALAARADELAGKLVARALKVSAPKVQAVAKPAPRAKGASGAPIAGRAKGPGTV